MKMEHFLYIDVDFLAEKYEEETGIAPNTIVSKTEGMDAQLSISFLKSKLQTNVTKQFSCSNQKMLKATYKNLNKYSAFKPNLTLGMIPVNAWVEGTLSIGQWGEQNHFPKEINVFYEVKSGDISYSLLPQNEYFLANLQALEIISPALQRHINIPVKMLCKVLYPLPDIKTFVVTPYIIEIKS